MMSLSLLVCTCFLAATALASELPRIEWQRETQRLLVPDGVYGRMCHLAGGGILLCSEQGRSSIVKRSDDGAETWTAPVRVATFEPGHAANPELCPLQDGGVLMFWNERPAHENGPHHFTIRMSLSRDGGVTWQPRAEPIFSGGNTAAKGCWEPAAVQMPDGEVRLFFAHELPGQQEIAMMTTRDAGTTWSTKQQASLRPNRRDGMPVPCLLNDGRLVFSIEDNGLAGQESKHPPYRPTIVDPTAKDRWMALRDTPGEQCNVSAPYLTRLPTGETLLSVQSNEDDPRRYHTVVYVGDEQARGFTQRSLPFGLPPETHCQWNALFALNADRVVALASATLDGKAGLWAITGHIRRKP